MTNEVCFFFFIFKVLYEVMSLNIFKELEFNEVLILTDYPIIGQGDCGSPRSAPDPFWANSNRV